MARAIPTGGRGLSGWLPAALENVPPDEEVDLERYDFRPRGLLLPKKTFADAFYNVLSWQLSGTITGEFGDSVTVDKTIVIDTREERWNPDGSHLSSGGKTPSPIVKAPMADFSDTISPGATWGNFALEEDDILANEADGTPFPALSYGLTAECTLLDQNKFYRKVVDGVAEFVLPIDFLIRIDLERPRLGIDDDDWDLPQPEYVWPATPFGTLQAGYALSDATLTVILGDFERTFDLAYDDSGTKIPTGDPQQEGLIVFYDETTRSSLGSGIAGNLILEAAFI